MNFHTTDNCFRLFHNNKSLFEASFCQQIGLTIEFPSDWHEDGTGTIHIGLLFFQLFIHFPWYKTYEDHHQCSGPQWGVMISNDAIIESFSPTLWLYYGNSDGTPKGAKYSIIHGPWSWGSAKISETVGEKETHEYLSVLKNGDSQIRQATIQQKYMEWRRTWIPWRMPNHSISIDFDDEVGEGSGSWKGGVLGCGYDMKKGETPLETLRRMEIERKF